MKTTKHISKKITELRKRMGLTLEGVSQLTGLHANTIWLLEQGRGNRIPLRSVMLLAQVYRVGLHEITGKRWVP